MQATLKRFKVNYINQLGLQTSILIDEDSPQAAYDVVERDGVGYDNGPVYAKEIIGVVELK